MELSEYQDRAKKYNQYMNSYINNFHTIMAKTLAQASEVGEVASKIQKVYRDDTDVRANLPTMVTSIGTRLAILDELGDILWHLSDLCWEFGTPLNTIAEANLEKLEDRLQRGKLRGSGDRR